VYNIEHLWHLLIYARTQGGHIMASPILKNLQAHLGIPSEKDELSEQYKDELSEQYKKLRLEKHATSEVEKEIRRLRRLESERKGLEPASIDAMDLVIIFEDLLLTRSTVNKAFDRHEVNDRKCAKWAERTIKYHVDKRKLAQAIDSLANSISVASLREMHMQGKQLENRPNTSIQLMEQYRVLDSSSIVKSTSYPSAWKKMKKQLDIARRLQAKDAQLAHKDKTISAKESEIKRLENELLRNKGNDWKLEAIERKKAGEQVTKIAKLVGKSRGTVSTYLNTAEVKLLINGTS
jgi:hypothetical protein